MEVLYQRCCGLDVDKKVIVACLIVINAAGKMQKEIRSFGTMTQDILALIDWLKVEGCTHVAMESTGVYWKPVYNLMEGQFELLVVNAQHIKAVPGRKTDVRDAEWIADLLQHGLLRGSFIPPAGQRELRELTRYRTSLVQERVRMVNRLQKVLEDTNIKLASVATDIMGVSARSMLEAMLGGQTDPKLLAELARGRMRDKKQQLEKALQGTFKPHHRFLLAEHLSHIDYLEEAIARASSEIEERMRPFEPELAIIDAVPGINWRVAETLLAEIGMNGAALKEHFPTADHLASWGGMCPGNNESAGKRKSGKTRKGSPWLRHILIEAAHGAAHSKDSYLAAQYRRIAARRGKKKALVAVGHSILVIVYNLLTRKQEYSDLGVNYFDERDRQAVERRLVSRLERLGYEVSLKPIAQLACA